MTVKGPWMSWVDDPFQAARIATLAEAGEILVSQETLGADLTPFAVSKPREVVLKGISDPVQVVTIDWR